MDVHDDRHLAGVEINKVGVGSFTGISEANASAARHDALG